MAKELSKAGGAAILAADSALFIEKPKRQAAELDNAVSASYTTTATIVGSKAGVAKVRKKADTGSVEAQCADKQSQVYQEIAAREAAETNRAVKMLQNLKKKTTK